MKLSQYTTFKEWYEDFVLFKKNPNDTHLFKAIDKKAKNSSDSVKNEIQIYLQNEALEYDPLLVFEEIMRTVDKNYRLVVKSLENPWFNC